MSDRVQREIHGLIESHRAALVPGRLERAFAERSTCGVDITLAPRVPPALRASCFRITSPAFRYVIT